MVSVGCDGDTETSRYAGPTNLAEAPLPFRQVRVVVTLVATPAVILVVAGAAASVTQVFVAAEGLAGEKLEHVPEKRHPGIYLHR